MESMFRTWVLPIILLFAVTTSSYAQLAGSQAYALFSAGYGSFQDTAQGSGSTPFGRIAIGAIWELEYATLGGEIGVQSGNQMQLENNIAAAFNYTSVPPLYLTVKEPIDILAVLKYHFSSPVFVQFKAGAVYLRTMTDSVSIPSESRVQAEIQAGAGYDLTCYTRLAVYYQQFFGQTPSLSDINSNTGTATLHNIPTWQAGMISFEVDF